MNKDEKLTVIGEDVETLDTVIARYKSDIVKMLNYLEITDAVSKDKLLKLTVTFDGNWWDYEDWNNGLMLYSDRSITLLDNKDGTVTLFVSDTADVNVHINKDGSYTVNYHPEVRDKKLAYNSLVKNLNKSLPDFIKHFWEIADKYQEVDLVEAIERQHNKFFARLTNYQYGLSIFASLKQFIYHEEFIKDHVRVVFLEVPPEAQPQIARFNGFFKDQIIKPLILTEPAVIDMFKQIINKQ